MRLRSTCERTMGGELKKTMEQGPITYSSSRGTASGQGETGRREAEKQQQLLHHDTERLPLWDFALNQRESMRMVLPGLLPPRGPVH